MKKEEIAAMIDHTILAPNISSSQVDKICEEAKEWNFASVCINPVFVTRAAENLKDSSVKVCTVIAFPLGATSTKDKVSETQHAIENGADEIDMVINISAALDGRFLEVGTDISEVVKIAKTTGEKLGKEITVKVILETCYLNDDTIKRCCILSKEAGADFVKTSTGFGTPKAPDGTPLPNGALEHHIRLMRETVGPKMGVKASGGIRSAETAINMINAGATRIGTSSGVNIIKTFE